MPDVDPVAPSSGASHHNTVAMANPAANRRVAEVDRDVDEPTEDSLLSRMIRRPDEDDFAEVLSPEGDSGDIVGSAVTGSTAASDASIGGTG